MESNKKYAVITGASSGIGYATAKAFAKRGKNLIIVARRKEQLEHLKKEVLEINPALDVVIKVCDLSILQNAYHLYDELTEYYIETWINNAGFGDYRSVSRMDLNKVGTMLRLNVETLTVLSSLYVRDYKEVEGTQLINISSGGGYVIVPNAVTYCATKFYVSAFTEGLAHELTAEQAKLQAKVLAPAATQTEFGKTANNVSEYDYDKNFGNYHTSVQMADLLLELYDSDQTVGAINRDSFTFSLRSPIFDYAGNSINNQKHIMIK
ncbi:SDR family NAD(P)-dependent oxidoreductase [Paenibacillus lautus]|uniref:SDR family NAD(P)-dependent oxidoreductase n=1 Tax=Paenibacillus lautus TaxID=1401 RepID=UPI002DBD92A0|nr:SDR family NAD(P)-dependent oxidoreductase [Paenibacillus lautus]MEC0206965.1 SDR family NAD(P)-dependent oxidoreductase [Paenibacillus lautus]